MSDSLVVDTNILIYAASAERDLDCVYVVSSLLKDRSLRIAIDNNYEILEEYRTNLKKYNNPLSNSFRKFIQKQVYETEGEKRIAVYIPIRKRKVSELIEMGFDKSDIKFVRIAPETDLQIIASMDERSFLDEEYAQWIEKNLDVTIMNIKEFKNFIQSK